MLKGGYKQSKKRRDISEAKNEGYKQSKKGKVQKETVGFLCFF
jgi:hypothetical protein